MPRGLSKEYSREINNCYKAPSPYDIGYSWIMSRQTFKYGAVEVSFLELESSLHIEASVHPCDRQITDQSLFVQQLVQASNSENIKDQHYWYLWGDSAVNGFPLQRASNKEGFSYHDVIMGPDYHWLSQTMPRHRFGAKRWSKTMMIFHA